QMPDGSAPNDGGLDGNFPLRDVTFAAQPAGPFAGATISGVTLSLQPFGGILNVQVQDLFGEGQDLALICGTVTASAPELHGSFSIVFNDFQQSLIVSVYDQNSQLIAPSPIDTIRDAQATHIRSIDANYKQLTAAVSPTANLLIRSISIASCGG